MEINPKKNYLLNYVGGKFQIAHWIIRHFKFHRKYVEIFGGGAHVVLQKQRLNMRGYEEVYNDLNDNLVNMYKVILDNPEKFFEKCQYLLYSRKLYNDWRNDWKNGIIGKDDFEKAIRYFYLQRLSFSGMWLNSFGSGASRTMAFQGVIKRIPYFVRRFQKVLIENLDFEECIKRYDEDETLFYADPPYLIDNVEYYRENGKVDKASFDHKRLAKALNNVRGGVVLSYYPHDKLKEWYGDWYVNFKKCFKSVNLVKAEKSEQRTFAVEMLLMNYKIKGLKQLKDVDLNKYK